MEIWLPLTIAEYEHYQVSNHGNIKNAQNSVMKLETTNKGYLRVTLSAKGVQKKFRVHRLVAQHFIPNPENKEQVNHKDTDKTNNHYTNLEWSTNQENMVHAYKNNLSYDVRLNGRWVKPTE